MPIDVNELLCLNSVVLFYYSVYDMQSAIQSGFYSLFKFTFLKFTTVKNMNIFHIHNYDDHEHCLSSQL